MFGAVAILLVVACANVASVMLARALARRREMGIRLAVGASRTRLARQLFVENVVLAAIGGGAGLALGHWALRLLISTAGDQIPSWANFDFDYRIAAFALVVTAATTILFGWAPALHAIRGNLKGAMHDAGTGTTAGPGGRRTLSWLVAAEFAMAALLLVASGLLFRAYQRVMHVDPGFRSDHVLTFMVALPEATYGGDEDKDGIKKVNAFWDRLTSRLSTLPGVEAVGLVSCPPLGCHWGTFFAPEGRPPLKAGETNPVVLQRPASPGYFKAMGIRLAKGRFLEAQDAVPDATVAVINEAFARQFWPGVSDPVGKRFRNPGNPKAPWITVVGVATDVKHYGLERPMRPGIYFPMTVGRFNTMTVAIRTTGDPGAFAATARGAMRELDAELPMYRVRTMEEAVKRSMAQRADLFVAVRNLCRDRTGPGAWRILRRDFVSGVAADARDRHSRRPRRAKRRHRADRAPPRTRHGRRGCVDRGHGVVRARAASHRSSLRRLAQGSCNPRRCGARARDMCGHRQLAAGTTRGTCRPDAVPADELEPERFVRHQGLAGCVTSTINHHRPARSRFHKRTYAPLAGCGSLVSNVP